MIALIQRVTSAAVDVKAKRVAKIECGILLLLTVEHNNTAIITERMIDRVLAYRVFADSDDRMNQSLFDIAGDLLIVPQFTRYERLNLTDSSRELFDYAVDYSRSNHGCVESGIFATEMQVHHC